jgi:cell division protein FtsB
MARRRRKIKSKNLKFQFLGLVVLAQVLFLLFNDFGLINWLKLNSQKITIQNDVEQLLEQQIKLKDDITQLNVDQEYIEKIAREKFMLVKPGEKVFKVIESKTMQK